MNGEQFIVFVPLTGLYQIDFRVSKRSQQQFSSSSGMNNIKENVDEGDDSLTKTNMSIIHNFLDSCKRCLTADKRYVIC